MVKLFTELGGLASFLFGISRILTKKVARNWFIGTLTEALFRVRKSLSHKEQKFIKIVSRQNSATYDSKAGSIKTT